MRSSSSESEDYRRRRKKRSRSLSDRSRRRKRSESQDRRRKSRSLSYEDFRRKERISSRRSRSRDHKSKSSERLNKDKNRSKSPKRSKQVDIEPEIYTVKKDFSYYQTRRIQRRKKKLDPTLLWCDSPEIEKELLDHAEKTDWLDLPLKEQTNHKKQEEILEDQEEFGPAILTFDQLNERSYGKNLLPGEGSAIASFVQARERIPRRGEIGLSGNEIAKFENLGFVMSGSRNRRMNAIRIRKENQVIAAEQQKAAKKSQLEERLIKEQQLIADMRMMLAKKETRDLK
jgi:hypothetical protein